MRCHVVNTRSALVVFVCRTESLVKFDHFARLRAMNTKKEKQSVSTNPNNSEIRIWIQGMEVALKASGDDDQYQGGRTES